jgi:hypothetical protein
MNYLPPSLVQFETELGEAIGRRRNRRRPVRLALRTGIATAAVAAIALGTFSVVSGHDPSAVARAAAALTAPSDAIIHVVLVQTETKADGTTSTERSESWERIGPDNAVREIRNGPGGPYETATVGAETQLYDPAARTVYIQQPEADKAGDLGAAKSVQASQAAAMDAVKAAKAAQEGASRHGATVADSDRFRTKIAALLDSGAVREDGHLTVDGRGAIRIVAAAGDMSLTVDAETYEPIEWRETGAGSTIITRFPTFERLVATDASTALLSLTAQYPDATVDRDPAHYREAVLRLTGKDDKAGSQEKEGASKGSAG